MKPNPVLEELYQARAAILAEYDGDVAAYLRDAQRRLVASGRPIADVQQRSLRSAEVSQGNPEPAR